MMLLFYVCCIFLCSSNLARAKDSPDARALKLDGLWLEGTRQDFQALDSSIFSEESHLNKGGQTVYYKANNTAVEFLDGKAALIAGTKLSLNGNTILNSGLHESDVLRIFRQLNNWQMVGRYPFQTDDVDGSYDILEYRYLDDREVFVVILKPYPGKSEEPYSNEDAHGKITTIVLRTKEAVGPYERKHKK